MRRVRLSGHRRLASFEALESASAFASATASVAAAVSNDFVFAAAAVSDSFV